MGWSVCSAAATSAESNEIRVRLCCLRSQLPDEWEMAPMSAMIDEDVAETGRVGLAGGFADARQAAVTAIPPRPGDACGSRCWP